MTRVGVTRAGMMAGVLLAAGSAAAQTMPAGRYESKVSGMGGPAQTHVVCLAEQTLDTTLQPPPEMAEHCPTREVVPDGQGVRMHIVCGGATMRGTAGPTGPDSFKTDMTMEMQGVAPMHVVTEIRRLGPCAPGEKAANRN